MKGIIISLLGFEIRCELTLGHESDLGARRKALGIKAFTSGADVFYWRFRVTQLR